MDELFNVKTILLHFLNTAVLFVALYFLMYKPVKRFMAKRSEGIRQKLTEAEKAGQAAAELSESGQAELKKAEDEAAKTVADGVERARAGADRILEDARRGAQEILEKAREDARKMKDGAVESMKAESAELALEIAGKILCREISPEDHRAMIDELLKTAALDRKDGAAL